MGKRMYQNTNLQTDRRVQKKLKRQADEKTRRRLIESHFPIDGLSNCAEKFAKLLLPLRQEGLQMLTINLSGD